MCRLYQPGFPAGITRIHKFIVYSGYVIRRRYERSRYEEKKMGVEELRLIFGGFVKAVGLIVVVCRIAR